MQHFITFHAIILKKFQLFITENKTFQQKVEVPGKPVISDCSLYTRSGSMKPEFFAKVTRLLHENDQKYFIQSNLHCYLHIFPTSPESDECHANKTVRLLNQTS